MADFVDEIISDVAHKSLKDVNADLELAVKNVEQLAAISKTIVFDFGKVKDLQTLNDLLIRSEQTVINMTDATEKLSKARQTQVEKDIAWQVKEREAQQRAYDDFVKAEEKKTAAAQAASDKRILQELAAEDKRNAARLRQLQKDEATLNRMIKAEEDAEKKKQLIADRAQKSKDISEAKTAAAAQKAIELQAKQQANAQKMSDAYIKELEKQQKALEAKTEKELKELEKANNAYEQLKKKYGEVAAEAKKLAAQYGVTSDEAKQAIEDAQKLNQELSAVEQAVGQHQRNVGNYASATMSVSQLIREAPAFANGIGTGLSALSNNIPILFDEFTRLRGAVGSTGEALSILFKSIFSFTNIFILLYAAFEIFGKSMFQASEASRAAKQSIDEYNDSLKSTNAQLGQNIAKETALTNQYLSTAANVALSIKTRVDAIGKLRSANAGLFDDYNDEYFLLGRTVEAMDRYNKAVAAKFVAQAYGEKSVAAMKSKFDLTSERVWTEADNSFFGDKHKVGSPRSSIVDEASDALTKANKEFDAFKKNISGADKVLGAQGDTWDRLSGRVKAAAAEYTKIKQQIADATMQSNDFNLQQQNAMRELEGLQPKENNDNIQALKAELQVRQSTLETMRLAKGITKDTKASEVDQLINSDSEFGARLKKQETSVKQLSDLIDKLEAKKKGAGGTRNGLSELSPTLTGEKDLLQAQLANRTQYLETIKAQQQTIIQDEKKTIQEREVASATYYATVIEQSIEAYHTQLAIEDDSFNKSIQKQIDYQNKLSELRAGKGGLSGAQRAKAISDTEALFNDESLKQDALTISKKTSEEKLNTETENAQREHVKNVLAINKSGNEQWIRQQQDAFVKTKLDEVTAYGVELGLLEQSYADKKITREKYDQQLRELKKKEQLIELESEIELDRRILKNVNLTNEQRVQYQKDLNSKLETQANIGAGQTSPSRKNNGRFTDALAKLAAPSFDKEDYDKQQKYLQQFYDATVNLARDAANAIVEISNNRFAQEQLNLQKQGEQIRTNAQQQADVINATADNEIDRKNQLSQLAAQTAAQEQQNEQEKRKVAQQQAKFQRTANIASIIGNTAVAITKTLAELGPLGIPIAALIGAAGGVQLAAAASAPIPQYWMGTDNHPGGPFVAGDGGERERIIPQGKPSYWSNSTSTLYNEGPGTKVIPESLYKNIDIGGGYTAGSITAQQTRNNSDIKYQHLANLIGEKLMQQGENLSYVIQRNGYRAQKQESMIEAVRILKNTQGL